MTSASKSPVLPVRVFVMALCAAIITAWTLAGAPIARAETGQHVAELPAGMQVEPFAAVLQEPRFDVLVFSRTTGFRHTDAIDAGHAAIQQMGAEPGREFNVTASEDAGLFTDAGLRPFEVVVFLNPDGEGILNGAQRTAFERWAQRGGGIVGIHASANADRNWDWMGDMMGGAWFQNHPSGANQFQTATVNIEDASHPATQPLPNPWVREDEWYNFTAEPRGKVHVLLTLDESTYEEEDGSAEADDHPIAWCSNYDGARHFYTALGHMGSYWAETAYRDHIRGAIEWAAGEAAGDCGPMREGLPTDASFDKVTLDDNTENPMELAVAPDGTVYYIELAGRVKMYDPVARSVRTIGTIPVHRGNENGLLGITLDPDFETNKQLYLFYSAPPQQGPGGEQHLSRFTLDANGNIDMASEELLLEFPHQRIICCHSAGSLAFGPGGELYISTGDDTTPFETSSFAPLDDDVLRNNVPGDPNHDANKAYDARRTSGNTNDLRGKILRIVPRDNPTGPPGPGNTYDIPPGNLFAPGTPLTRPEIYTMGHRNPFRIQVDPETGWLYNGEVGPDANNDSATRGPRGYDEINQIRQAGNMGWPFCSANNSATPSLLDSYAYNDFTYPSGPSGPAFDCSGAVGGGPVNNSNYNTGLTQLPPARPALLWWPYTPYPAGFPFPGIPTGPGRTAIAGPTYHFDPANPSETKFPAFYDDKVFFADWSRDWIATMTLTPDGTTPAEIKRFMPYTDFRHVQDMEMGADGSLYILEWGRDFNFAGQGINPDSGLYRIDFVKGKRSPVARASANRDTGPAPLEVTFSSAGSDDPDGDDLTYEWNFGDGTPVSNEPNPTHSFTEPGQYTVRLLVTDTTGKSGTSTLVITAGNTRPTVDIEIPEQGGVHGWGDGIDFRVNVSDPEDDPIDCSRVEVAPGIFHDEGGNAHVHPGVNENGCVGSFEAPADSGHEKNAVIALVVTATYTDDGGSGGAAPPLLGADTHRLNPNQIQAEHFNAQSGVTIEDRVGAEGGRRTASSAPGDWIYFDPVSLKGIDQLRIRYTAACAGGLVELRLDAPDGPLVGTADLVTSGGANVAGEVTTAIDPAADDAPHRLYLVYAQRPGGPTDNLFELDELTFVGRGVATDAAPSAAIQADRTSGSIPLTVNFTGVGNDPEGTELSYEWDFQSDGTVDATTKDAAHTYTTVGVHNATLKVSDAGGRSRTATVRIEAFPPIAGCPGDDDFTGTALDRSLWSVVREVPSDLIVGGGNLTIQSRPGDIFAGSESGAQGPMQNIVLQDLPDFGPWTATTRMTWNPTANFQNAGFKIYDSDDNWIKFGMVWSGGRRLEFYKELNDGPTNLNTTGILPADFPSTFQLRLVSDGTSITAQYSANGVQWTNMGTAQTNLNGFLDPRIGMYATSTNQPSIPASFDWFKLDFPGNASDEFDGDALDLCRWTEIVRHDPEGYEVTGGELVMPAAHGDFFGNGPNDNPNIVLQPAPSGEWTATTRLRFTPNENYEQAGLIVYGDDANYAKADLVSAGGNRVMEFLRETNNSAEGFGGSVTLPSGFPDTVEIRVTSDGEMLRSEYRPVGGEWAPFGEPAPLANIPAPKIGVYANDGNQNVSTREQAAFDFFRLTSGPPDEEPPTTVAELDPAAPDGEGGWYVSPVQVTLSTEEGATTEYKVGDGAFQAYDGPFTLEADGTHVVTYRSTDAAGNVEADKTVTVKIDRTGPSVACTAVPGELRPVNGRFVQVAVGLDVDDGGSGTGSFRLESVTSSEGGTDFARNWRVGSADTLGELRAQRTSRNGRTYTLAYTVFDRAGNGTPCEATVVVPRRGGDDD